MLNCEPLHPPPSHHHFHNCRHFHQIIIIIIWYITGLYQVRLAWRGSSNWVVCRLRTGGFLFHHLQDISSRSSHTDDKHWSYWLYTGEMVRKCKPRGRLLLSTLQDAGEWVVYANQVMVSSKFHNCFRKYFYNRNLWNTIFLKKNFTPGP